MRWQQQQQKQQQQQQQKQQQQQQQQQQHAHKQGGREVGRSGRACLEGKSGQAAFVFRPSLFGAAEERER